MIEEKNIPYEDFVIGVNQGTIKFEVVQKRNYAKLFYDPFVGLIIRILLVLVIAPIIAIPILCYMLDKWILLLGFLGLAFGLILHSVSLHTSKPIKSLITTTFSLGFTAIILIYFIGILHPIAFIFICVLYQFFFLNFSDLLYDEIAKNNLIKNADKYYFATKNNIIKIFSNY